MKREIKEIIKIPEGVEVEVDGYTIKISKGGVTLEKKLPFKAKKENNEIVIGMAKSTKREKKLIKTASSHVRALFSGLGKKYSYKLQVCAVHFPITAQTSGNEVVIKNFLGEVKERRAKILPNVDVKVNKEIITVESFYKDSASQTAANIENATFIRARDRRVFQDGIYITEKEKGKRKE